MAESVLESLIVTLLATAIAATCKRFWKWLCKPPPTKSEILFPRFSAKEIKKHFWISFSVFVSAIVVYTTVSCNPSSEDDSFLKLLLLIIAGLAFVAVGGSLDEALSYIPQDHIEIPADNSTD